MPLQKTNPKACAPTLQRRNRKIASRYALRSALARSRSHEPLRKGAHVDGTDYLPMIVSIDRQQGANAWLTVGLREGKNREIRRAMESIGLSVNRLIRVSYGPFQLGQLKPGEVEEVRSKILRDQLGLDGAKPDRPKPQRTRRKRIR